MNTATRTDCHCPSNLIPTDYEYVAQECMKIEGLGDCFIIQDNRRIIAEHMARTGGTYSNHLHGGNCMVCGSVNAVYTVLFYHAKSNTYIRMGQECAELADRQAAEGLNRLRREIKDAREYQKGVKKAQALLADAGISEAWNIHKNCRPADYKDRQYEEETICDIVGKLIRYGSISDGQIKFIRSLMDKIVNRAQVEAQRKAEAAAAAPCPTGRVEVSGEVLTVRVDESPYGQVTKMLVKAVQGFKVWSSMPAHAHANRGDKIVFKAELTPSQDDPKFGFGKRPKLISIEHKSDAA